MQIIKIGLSSREFKHFLADESTWNDYSGGGIPSGRVEVRTEDGEQDSGDATLFDWSDVVQWRAV